MASASLPYIENHIPGLTIYVENAIKLPTTSETTGHGIIETDVDMTIRSNNCYLALEGNGGSTVGILVKNGATLTLDGARLNILSVGRGIVGKLLDEGVVAGSHDSQHALAIDNGFEARQLNGT